MTMMRDEYFSEEQTLEFEKILKISSFHYSQLTDLMQFSASVLKLQQFSALVWKLQFPNYCWSISFNLKKNRFYHAMCMRFHNAIYLSKLNIIRFMCVAFIGYNIFVLYK